MGFSLEDKYLIKSLRENKKYGFCYLQHMFFQLFTLKFLCKLVDVTKIYVRKQKGFFPEHTVSSEPTHR